ncbi:MAG: amylo-alpha-1,6-glucosidase [Verrucomicrobia bacterium]|nr:MAG: amylo-alpha-1,6-glucosidase [Verrucomicrobiota bacterium]
MTDLRQSPAPGSRWVRHAGDRVEFEIGPVPQGWRARLRTNIGRAVRLREEIVRSHFERIPLAGASWRDLPMPVEGGRARLSLPLAEVGYFKSKAYLVDPDGFQHWPAGADTGVGVHPSWTRTGNTIYCAFPRMFGSWSKARERTQPDHEAPALRQWDAAGFTVIPPGGTLRDLQRELSHIVGTLGCRIVHLLPVSPVPTTFARFGRFGSPYALQDLTAIDPALVEFDRRTTGVDQFRELTYAVHARGARVMLDLVINHTGWGSREWNDHPEWFLRGGDGTFHSPGAWGTVWEDLVELDQRHVPLWDYLANVFLTWCRRGVDGFRCDAGYKIPVHVWQFITARVRQEFPDTVFLLEGLGGSWEATDALLTEGGMQWAYSELFQNVGSPDVGSYLRHSLEVSGATGTLVHYSETHDNCRLAALGAAGHAPPTPEGRRWSLHRNRLSALASVGGGFGFTNGVEWCATEQVNVHGSRGLNWGAADNIVGELARLGALLSEHPCFFDGASIEPFTPAESPVVGLERRSAEGTDSCLVLANVDLASPRSLRIPRAVWESMGSPRFDLVAPHPGDSFADPAIRVDEDAVELTLGPGATHCLSSHASARGLSGENYRRARARADWAIAAYGQVRHTVEVPSTPWRELSAVVDRDPAAFLASTFVGAGSHAAVVEWGLVDRNRVVPVPPGHWLLVRDDVPFRAALRSADGSLGEHVEGILAGERYVAAFAPRQRATRGVLALERYGVVETSVEGPVQFLGAEPTLPAGLPRETFHGPLVLLTNGRGGMARLGIELGRITSKYDCLLGANLHARVPVDRHVFAKRARVWINADGFITPLDAGNLVDFEAGPPAHWRFVANAGDGRSVEVHLVVDLLPERNTLVMQFSRPDGTPPPFGRPLPTGTDVRLTLRVDVEDRNFHWTTQRNGAAEGHFEAHCRPLLDAVGFEFAPASERRLRVMADSGRYHPQPEWTQGIGHPVETTRGMDGSGDAYSPGWFDLPLAVGGTATLTVDAETDERLAPSGNGFVAERVRRREEAHARAGVAPTDAFGRALVNAVQAFVVRRDATRTVIAGYPWFLDWGRDSLIAARGLLAAGMVDEVRELLVTFARFEEGGTLPNSIHGEDASNRETSDAPLWFGVVCEDVAERLGKGASAFYATVVDDRGRSLSDVLRSIASGYLAGTRNGIHVDHASGLVWSPSHFTWMDTNHPAGTPREGYPVEIQALWIRLLRQLGRLRLAPWDGRGESWADLARRAEKSFHAYFWLEQSGWPADVLLAPAGHPARTAPPSDALRSNCLLPVALGLLAGDAARRTVAAAARYLVVPGALRSLAPLTVTPPLPVRSAGGGLLNDPDHPYWPRYEGDEDTRRKPAYHNGTAWTWTFPTFCEAMVKAHPDDPAARAAARAYLGSMAGLLAEGCVGQIPEILDGDAPHTQRGCDAQAWGVTEALRVWRWL